MSQSFIVSCKVMGDRLPDRRFYNEERMYWESDVSRATRFPVEDRECVERMLDRQGAYRKGSQSERTDITFHDSDDMRIVL